MLWLAAPRGTCAGVDRAIRIVQLALERYGPPIYVRHEIVHNRHVVMELRAAGAVFVDEVDEVPVGATVVFSAHGVPKSTRAEAEGRSLRVIDATCPLVAKVHREVVRHYSAGRAIVLIGHADHAEVQGTLGQLPPGAARLVQNGDDVASLDLDPSARVAYAVQTTLATDEVAGTVAALSERFADLASPSGADVCFATSNRQAAVRAIAPQVEKLIVVGSANSSNSRRLVEVALRAGCASAKLVEDAASLDWQWVGRPASLGLSAGASAPERLVQHIVAALSARFTLTINEVAAAVEGHTFRLPVGLERGAKA